MSLPECLERAARSLPTLADQIRPANGDPRRLLDLLEPADAARVLAWVIADEEGAADELLDAWGEMEGGASVLMAVPEGEVPKAGRKQLRRALHRLRAQGVAVADPEPVAAVAAPPRRIAASDRWQAAHLSAPDFRGTRMGYLVDDHPAGGARLFEIRFDADRGILDFKVYNAGRSKVRGFLKSLVEGTRQRLFEVEHDALCALVRRASQRQPADRALPTGFVEWRSRLFPDALASVATPGERARAELGTASDGAKALASVEEAIRGGRIGPWPPATAWVGERMEGIQKKVAELAGDTRAKAIADWKDEVAGELAGETNTRALAEQLAEWAWIEWRREDPERARELLAASAALSGAVASGDGADANRALARARADALFGPFLDALAKDALHPMENDGK